MSAFLDACRGQTTDHTPIWIMRQAGRYQPSYRALREKVSFLELCKTPELAAQVTVRAAKDLGTDAAIIFADILLLLEPLNVDFGFHKDHGPKIYSPIRTNTDVEALSEKVDPKERLSFVGEAIKLVRKEIPNTPLIGFAGAPFTLASYAIEGGGSKNYYETKRFMHADEARWHVLMEKITSATINYLKFQHEAGAQALQIFDSWIGCLSRNDYRRFIKEHMTRLFSSLPKDVPHIHFGLANEDLYQEMFQAGGDVFGVDWRVPLHKVWEQNKAKAMMGNLDPAYLLAPREALEKEVSRILHENDRAGHIFNLGHGIMPLASEERAKHLVDFVHEESIRIRKNRA